MTKKPYRKLIHEGQYMAEVDVEMLIADDDWSPYLSLDDAYRLDVVRQALKQNDMETATKLARVFKLLPLTPAA